MPNRYLIASDDTANHLDLISSPTGARAFLGDPQKLTTHSNRVMGIHIDVANYTKALSRLSRDATKNEAQQHLAARDIGMFLNQRLTDAAGVLRQGATALHTEALEIAAEKFNGALVSGNLESDIRAFARELTSQPGGHVKLKALAAKDITLAATIYRSPGFLIGVEDAAEHKNLKLDAIADHVPDATSRMVESGYLIKTAAQYDSTAKKYLAVWNPQVVARAEAGRVDLPTPVAASI
jgi:hypothetical protein